MSDIPAEAVKAAAAAHTRIMQDFRGSDAAEEAIARAMLEAAAPAVRAAERERIRTVLGESFKVVLVQPENAYPVDAVAWTNILSVLGPAAGLFGDRP